MTYSDGQFFNVNNQLVNKIFLLHSFQFRNSCYFCRQKENEIQYARSIHQHQPTYLRQLLS